METATKRTRRTLRTRTVPKSQSNRGSKQICLPISFEVYTQIWDDAKAVRAFIAACVEESPELFPGPMKRYQLTGRLPESSKLPGIQLRQLRLGKTTYSLRPSFVLPYMTGYVNDVAYPLRLLMCGVPPWLIAEGFGHDANYWDRQVERLGRNSLVGTTVCDPERLPQHVVTDEHQVSWAGQKAFLPMTVGDGCVLNMDLVLLATDACLKDAYGVFAQEAREVDPSYSPETVNTDGWQATQNAWQAMFPLATLIRCILHGFLKIRERCNKAFEHHQRVWDVYRAPTVEEFRRRMVAFRQWVDATDSLSLPIRTAMLKFCERTEEYARAYAHPGCRRTSNMVDRLMNRIYRKLYAQRGLHGHYQASVWRLRGWALLHNFCPFAPRAGRPREYSSPAHRLNQKRYSENWFENLMISASLQGRRPRT